jgi:uroporphyrinogen decarboxylase
MDLAKRVTGAGRRLVMPLMGYPGIQLNHTSIKQNEFNWGVQFWTLQTLVRVFEPDGIFVFMDLSVEASALGLPVRFPLYESPTVEEHLVEELDDLNQFLACDPLRDGRVIPYIETIRLLKQGLAPGVIKGAYVTGPFSLAGLMMGANDIAIKTLMDESLVMGVLEVATSTTVRYARALVEAGADTIAILDPTAVILSPEQYERFSGQFTKRIVEELDVPCILHICGDATHLIPTMCQSGAQALSLDSAVSPTKAFELMPDDVVFIGNVDPVRIVRDGTPAEVRQAVHDLLEEVDGHKNFILSTGCDLPADTPVRNIHAFMDAAKEWNHQHHHEAYA